ncbi:glycoside hydrolase family protein [Brevundimonas sp.]|uniref:glycoside hydrolase family protein n=1 Tax=Brevundimonas sp. TaxID=1871086 RepID=UPI002E0FE036|nr:glycoside hydrolase family protein [Brevundimonas sp.]
MSETRRPDLEHPVSEPAVPARRKVSREGIVLLKSFEGFRARAERDGDGWVIGYGHRKSAREGLTVGEADAELLLQYDLMPVAQALNALPVALNAHQFDALASFAFSVGVERFLASDVHARLAEARPDAAAEALLAWSEPAPAVAGLRRRAAERALFLADPHRPVALAELLAAPLPASPEPITAPVAEARAAAVAALLGEAEAPAQPDPEPEPRPVDAVSVPSFMGTDVAETLVVEPAPEPVQVAPPAEPSPRIIAQFAAPYGPAIVGPLPGFPTAAGPAAPAAPTPAKPAPLPLAADPVVEPEVAPQPEPEPAPDPAAAQAPMPPAAASDAPWPTPPTSPFPAPTVEPLVLTPAPESEAPAPRPIWDEAVRGAETPAPDQDVLFVEAPSQTSILRHEEEPDGPRRFDWSETGMYVIMGGLGLVSCAVSAAAFRVAVEDPSPMGETTAVAWTLAVIGAVCVGAASRHFWIRATSRKG